MGKPKKSKTKKGKQRGRALSLTGGRDQSTPQNYQGHGEPEKQDEGSEDCSSSSNSHSGRSVSPHELKEEANPTQREEEERQNIVQLPDEGGSNCQQLEEGGSVGQPQDEGQSNCQWLEEDGSVGRLREEGGSNCQQVEEGGSVARLQDEGGSTCQQLEEDGSIGQQLEDHNNIDQRLEEAAAKSSLSVLNVKSILHHVLKDRRVLALVQRRVAEEEGRELSGEWQEDIVPYEPKLTRSRVRQAVASSVSRGAVSPEKIASLSRASHTPCKATDPGDKVIHPLLDVTFSEESSDEEYNPAADVSEESEGEESDEELGDTSLCDAEVPPIGDRQDGLKSTGTISTVLPGSASQVSPLVTQLCESTTTEVQTSNISSPASVAPPFSGPSQTLASASASSQTVSSMPASTVTQISSPNSSTMMQRAETVTTGVCALPTSSVSSDTQPSTFSAPAPLPTTSPTIVTASKSDDLMVQEAAALLASLSDTILSPMKIYLPQGQEDTNEPHIPTSTEEDEDLIATRTRSKHPLTDTSISAIEASFIPPDVEEPPTPMELDDEELEWQQWLHDLMNPSDSPVSADVRGEDGVVGGRDIGGDKVGEEVDDGDDMDYNYLADQQPEEEKEEFRNDRAVKIPQKEVDDLLNELLNPADDGLGGLLLSGDGIDLTSAYLLESLGLQPPLLMQSSGLGTPQKAAHSSDPSTMHTVSGDRDEHDTVGCQLSTDQAVQVWTQIQQHLQLLMQTFVLSRFEPSLVFLSQISAQAIEEITKWCDEAKEGKNSPVWYIPNLEEAKGLIQALDPNNQEVELVPATGNPTRIPETVQDIIFGHELFWNYPQLLPGVGFAALSKENASGLKYFTPEEDYLLVLGMDHYGPSSWKLIQENILPTKTVKQLQLRVKNQCSKRTGENVVKYYKRTKEVKIPYRDNGEEKIPELPQWVLQYHKKRLEKEKLQEKRREKETNDSCKMAKLLDSVLKPPTKQVTLKAKTVGVSTNVDNTEAEATLASFGPQAGGSSKRNLNNRLQEAESEAKRLCLGNGDHVHSTSTSKSLAEGPRGRSKNIKHGRKRGQPQKVEQPMSNTSPSVLESRSSPLQQSPENVLQPLNSVRDGHHSASASPVKCKSNSKGDMEQLLWAAGLEACDPTARYAYNYLTEVKATLLSSKQGTYEEFLKALLDAKKQRWKPSKLFRRVQQILQPWPHLIKLFTEFMEPQDCLEAEVMADKYELESVKAFVETLQTKFSGAPLQLEDAIGRIRQLNTPSVTREKVMSSLLPLIEAHEELIEELKRILFHLAPPPRTEDVYEEITIGSDCEKEPDEFEEMILSESPPLRMAEFDRKIKTRDKMTPTALKSPPMQCNPGENLASMKKFPEEKYELQLDNIKHLEGSSSSHAVAALHDPKICEDDDQEHGQTPAVMATSLSFTPVSDAHQRMLSDKRVAITSKQSDNAEGQSESDSNRQEGLPASWSRNEDRVVLQYCLHQKTETSAKAFQNIATQLNRTETEVQQRYKELLVLFHSSYSDSPSS